MENSMISRSIKAFAAVAGAALVLTACSGGGENTPAGGGDGAAASYKIGVNQLVQHPALDASVEGFKEAFSEAGIEVEWDDQNANGEQATALTIAQQFADGGKDLVLAVATPAAQASAQAITDVPVLFTAVTDAVEAKLVDSNEAPGGNVTGTSDAAPLEPQLDLIEAVVPGVKTIGIVYSSGEVNSQVQVDAVQAEADKRGWSLKTQTVTTANDIQQAVEALGAVDAVYVPTDNMVVAGIASLVKVAEAKQIPVFAAESGTVDGGAIATVGIDYKQLGKQTGEMAIKILTEGADPGSIPVETAKDFDYVVNEEAAKRMGVELPADVLQKANKG